jgi:gliding motility-associated-like protein
MHKKLQQGSFFQKNRLFALLLTVGLYTSIHAQCPQPFANTDSAVTFQNVPIIIDVRVNDTNGEGLALTDTLTTTVIITQPDSGSVITLDNDSIIYTPNSQFAGSDTFEYATCDICGCDTTIVIVTVLPFCNAPIAANDIVDLYNQLTFEIDATANDQNPTGGLLNVGIFSGPSHGTAVVTNNNIYYTGDGFYTGPDTIVYQICNDCPKCDTGFIYLNVQDTTLGVVAVNDSFGYTWGQGIIFNVLANDTLNSGSPFTVTILSNDSAHAFIAVNGNNSISYTPADSFAGIDTFYYVVCNADTFCDTAMVLVYIPVDARNDSSVTGEGQATGISLLDNDTRPAGLVVSLCGGPANGTISGIDNSGLITYTPNTGFYGVDTVCYQVCYLMPDSSLSCDVAIWHITVLNTLVDIPEGFSPDGDGINDLFVIPGSELYPASQLLVYNRYGDEVWKNEEESGYDNDFDGIWKDKNVALTDGTYYYIFKFNNGINKDIVGYIVLNR